MYIESSRQRGGRDGAAFPGRGSAALVASVLATTLARTTRPAFQVCTGLCATDKRAARLRPARPRSTPTTYMGQMGRAANAALRRSTRAPRSAVPRREPVQLPPRFAIASRQNATTDCARLLHNQSYVQASRTPREPDWFWLPRVTMRAVRLLGAGTDTQACGRDGGRPCARADVTSADPEQLADNWWFFLQCTIDADGEARREGNQVLAASRMLHRSDRRRSALHSRIEDSSSRLLGAQILRVGRERRSPLASRCASRAWDTLRREPANLITGSDFCDARRPRPGDDGNAHDSTLELRHRVEVSQRNTRSSRKCAGRSARTSSGDRSTATPLGASPQLRASSAPAASTSRQPARPLRLGPRPSPPPAADPGCDRTTA